MMQSEGHEEFNPGLGDLSIGEVHMQQFWQENEELCQFLFSPNEMLEEPSSSVRNTLTPDNYLFLIALTLDNYGDDEPQVTRAFERFAQYSLVDFIEPVTPEEELTHSTVHAEAEISSFIEFNHPSSRIDLLGEIELEQLCEIYNPNNMLAFAKDLVERSQGSLSPEQVDMIYRYRVLLKRFDVRREALGLMRLEARVDQRKTKDGNRTWAGYVHPYGFESGRIERVEHKEFSESEDLVPTVVYVKGEPVRTAFSEKIQ